MYGKKIRIERIIDRKTGNYVIVPMDHGVSSGPIEGLIDINKTIDEVSEGGATAVLMHKGLVSLGHNINGRAVGLILHLSASTDIGTQRDRKILVSTVEEAIKLGADAVSVHINIGSDTEADMLNDLGKVSKECYNWGIPLMCMAYLRGPKIKNPYDPDDIAHAARIVTELGADIVKCNYTGDIDSFKNVVKGALSPVIIAGGPKMESDLDILTMVHESIEAGGKGVSIGRNIFQHRNIKLMTKAIGEIVLNNASVEEAHKIIR